jgi:CRISPR-associated endonuclease Csn1
MSFSNTKLTQNQKNLLINNFIINGKQNLTIKQLAKFLEVDEIDITGLREDANKKKLITEFKGLKKIIKPLSKERKRFYLDNFEILDKVANVLTSTKVISERKQKLKSLDIEYITEEEIEAFANVPGISGYHSLSFKAIYLINREMVRTNDNQIQVLYRLNLHQSNLDFYRDKINIPSDHELIINPVVRRSLNEAIKVVNSLRKKYGEFDSIIIEMARDKNTKEEKKRITKEIKKRNETNKQILDDLNVEDLNKRVLIKLLLYHQQQGKCLYTGTPLDRNLIISDPHSYHIDHIIPVSVSYDDSLNNKALVLYKANLDKDNLTPIMAFNNHRFDGWDKKTYVAFVNMLLKSKLITNKKKDYLLYEEDVTKYSNMGNFIARNLVDTRYASRGVLNILQDYFSANDIATKVFAVRGNITSVIRNKVGIVKDRDDNYIHHAIDAATIALLPSHTQINRLLNKLKYSGDAVEVEQSEENPVVSQREFFEESFMKRFVSLKNLAEEHKVADNPYSYLRSEIKISHKVDRKPNRKLADDTIYSTRNVNGQELVVKKYQDIYDAKFMNLAKDIYNKNYHKYLMYHHDPQTFDKLIEIVDDYLEDFKEIKTENPFNIYFKQHGKVKKYSKKNNGPDVTSLKYYDGQLISHVSLNAKQHSKNKNIVLLQIKSYRTDFYRNKEGFYKFVTIRMHHVQHSKSRNIYFIDKNVYSKLLEEKGVGNDFEFQFSMHRNEYLYIEQKIRISKNIYDVDKEIYRYVATNNDNKNVVEVKPINYRENKQVMKTIGKNILKLTKYHCDILGNIYESNNESLKLEFNIGKM